MHKQRWIDMTFAAMTGAVSFARLSRAAAPVCATVLAVGLAMHSSRSAHSDTASEPTAAAWSRSAHQAFAAFMLRDPELPATDSWRFWGMDPSRSDREVRALILDLDRALDDASNDATASADAEAATEAKASPRPHELAKIARPSPELTPEQRQIVRYIARTYRIALDPAQQFVHYAYRIADELKLDPLLILAVMSVESNFNPRAQSHAGAQGLMQVLTRVHAERFERFGGVTAAFDPFANILVGSTILKEYLQREGTVPGALKAYVGAAMLPNDRGYGAKVLSARNRIAAAAHGVDGDDDRAAASTSRRVIERTTRADQGTSGASHSSEI